MFVSLRVCVGRAILVSWFVVMEVCRSCKFVFYTGLLVNGAVVWLWDVIILICVGLYLLAMGLWRALSSMCMWYQYKYPFTV